MTLQVIVLSSSQVCRIIRIFLVEPDGMCQKFRKWFHILLDKIMEIAYAFLGLTKFEGLEGSYTSGK